MCEVCTRSLDKPGARVSKEDEASMGGSMGGNCPGACSNSSLGGGGGGGPDGVVSGFVWDPSALAINFSLSLARVLTKLDVFLLRLVASAAKSR